MQQSFSYLLPDQKLQSIPVTDKDIIEYIKGKKIRKVYQNVQYDQLQTLQIKQFRTWAQSKFDLENVPDKTIIRYLYSFQFNHKDSLQRLKLFLQWFDNPLIQRFDDVTLELINSGVCYTYGRDLGNRPIIYLNVSLMDMSRYVLDDYLSAINAIVNLVIDKLFIKGKLQNYMFIIDTGNKNFSSLPLSTVKQMVLKLSYVYSMRMGKLLIINCNYLIKLMYSAVHPFLADITKEKIKLLSHSDVQNGKMKQFIDINQFQQKYGGFREDQFKNGHLRFLANKQLEEFEFQDDRNKSQYYSCQNNQDLFEKYGENAPQMQGCCASNQCNIY